jgi:hypothetical protein
MPQINIRLRQNASADTVTATARQAGATSVRDKMTSLGLGSNLKWRARVVLMAALSHKGLNLCGS